jgi:hypothetical protein
MAPRKDRLSRHRPQGDTMYSIPTQNRLDFRPRMIVGTGDFSRKFTFSKHMEIWPTSCGNVGVPL